MISRIALGIRIVIGMNDEHSLYWLKHIAGKPTFFLLVIHSWLLSNSLARSLFHLVENHIRVDGLCQFVTLIGV